MSSDSLNPFLPPESPLQEIGGRRRNFGWWLFLIIYALICISLLIPALQRASREAVEYVDTPSIYAEVRPRAVVTRLLLTFLPLILVAPWVGEWINRAVTTTKKSLLWKIPVSALVPWVTLFLVFAVGSLIKHEGLESGEFAGIPRSDLLEATLGIYAIFFVLHLALGLIVLVYVKIRPNHHISRTQPLRSWSGYPGR